MPQRDETPRVEAPRVEEVRPMSPKYEGLGEGCPSLVFRSEAKAKLQLPAGWGDSDESGSGGEDDEHHEKRRRQRSRGQHGYALDAPPVSSIHLQPREGARVLVPQVTPPDPSEVARTLHPQVIHREPFFSDPADIRSVTRASQPSVLLRGQRRAVTASLAARPRWATPLRAKRRWAACVGSAFERHRRDAIACFSPSCHRHRPQESKHGGHQRRQSSNSSSSSSSKGRRWRLLQRVAVELHPSCRILTPASGAPLQRLSSTRVRPHTRHSRPCLLAAVVPAPACLPALHLLTASAVRAVVSRHVSGHQIHSRRTCNLQKAGLRATRAWPYRRRSRRHKRCSQPRRHRHRHRRQRSLRTLRLLELPRSRRRLHPTRRAASTTALRSTRFRI